MRLVEQVELKPEVLKLLTGTLAVLQREFNMEHVVWRDAIVRTVTQTGSLELVAKKELQPFFPRFVILPTKDTFISRALMGLTNDLIKQHKTASDDTPNVLFKHYVELPEHLEETKTETDEQNINDDELIYDMNLNHFAVFQSDVLAVRYHYPVPLNPWYEETEIFLNKSNFTMLAEIDSEALGQLQTWIKRLTSSVGSTQTMTIKLDIDEHGELEAYIISTLATENIVKLKLQVKNLNSKAIADIIQSGKEIYINPNHLKKISNATSVYVGYGVDNHGKEVILQETKFVIKDKDQEFADGRIQQLISLVEPEIVEQKEVSTVSEDTSSSNEESQELGNLIDIINKLDI